MRKNTIKLIAIILGVALVIGAIAFGTGLFKVDEEKQDEYFGKKLNEDNYYTVDCLDLKDSNDGNGITVDVDEKKGGIKLNGTAAIDLDYTVGKVTLSAGTYTITACDEASNAGVYVTASAGSEVIKFDFTPGNNLTVEAETEYTITIHIVEGTELNNCWVLPVIVEGTEPGDYYA